MTAEIILTIDWEKSEVSGDDRVIETKGDLLEYIVGILQSNANYDHVELKIADAAISEVNDD
jgi:hypothetical protein